MVLELNIGSNTRKAVTGVEDIGDALEKVSDSLDDAGQDSDKLERKFSSDMRDMAADASRTGSKIGTEIRDGTDKAGKGVETMQSRGVRSIGRLAGSIHDVSDGLNTVQQLAGTAFAGFGPAGVAAGAVAGIAIGLVSSALKSAQEEADKTKKRITEAYQAAAEEGRTALDEAQITAAAMDIIFDTAARTKAQKEAKEIGVDVQTYIRALAGDQEALNTALAIGTKTQGEMADAGQLTLGRKSLESQYVDGITDKLETQKAVMQDNAEAANLALTIRGQDGEVIRANNKSLAETPKSVPVKLTVDSSAIDNALTRRTLRIDVEGYTRAGARVI